MIKKFALGVIAILAIGLGAKLILSGVQEGWGWLFFLAFVCIASLGSDKLISVKKTKDDGEEEDEED